MIIHGTRLNDELILNVGIISASGLADFEASRGHALEKFPALIDTGAIQTMITPHVVDVLGLTSSGRTSVRGVGREISEYDAYEFHVVFIDPEPKPTGAWVNFCRKLIRSACIPNTHATHPCSILLGMDILSMGALRTDPDGSFSFSLQDETR